MDIKVYRPVAGSFAISSPFGFRQDPVDKTNGEFHYGTDFAVPVGTPVVAAVDGIIDAVGFEDPANPGKGFGLRVRQVFVQNRKQYVAYYGHLSDTSVIVGDHLDAGTRVGLSGNTGKSTGAHLHFEVREMGKKGLPVEFI